MKSEALLRLIELNNRERALENIQADIDKARRKYFDVNEIQLRLDRRQAELNQLRQSIIDSKSDVISPN